MINIEERRQKAETRRDELLYQIGVLTLNSGSPQHLHDELQGCDREISALMQAEAEQVRREREALARAEAERKVEARKRLAQARDESLAEIAKATEALNVVVASMRGVFSRFPAMGRDMEILGGVQAVALAAPEFERRASGWISAELSRITGHPAHFGSMKLHIQPNYGATDWHAAEQREFDRALSNVINPDQEKV